MLARQRTEMLRRSNEQRRQRLAALTTRSEQLKRECESLRQREKELLAECDQYEQHEIASRSASTLLRAMSKELAARYSQRSRIWQAEKERQTGSES